MSNAAASSISSHPGQTAPLIHPPRKPWRRCINGFIWSAPSLRVNIKLVEVKRSSKWSDTFICQSLGTLARTSHLWPASRRDSHQRGFMPRTPTCPAGAPLLTPVTLSSPTTTLSADEGAAAAHPAQRCSTTGQFWSAVYSWHTVLPFR